MTTGRHQPERTLADGVRRLGFRKWYERELLSGHAHMVLSLLATVALLASIEAMRGGSLSEQLMDLGFSVASGVIGLWALRRYLFLLMHAEGVANQANCPHCAEYGRFEVVGEHAAEGVLRVRCRKCQSNWLIHD